MLPEELQGYERFPSRSLEEKLAQAPAKTFSKIASALWSRIVGGAENFISDIKSKL